MGNLIIILNVRYAFFKKLICFVFVISLFLMGEWIGVYIRAQTYYNILMHNVSYIIMFLKKKNPKKELSIKVS